MLGQVNICNDRRYRSLTVASCMMFVPRRPETRGIRPVRVHIANSQPQALTGKHVSANLLSDRICWCYIKFPELEAIGDAEPANGSSLVKRHLLACSPSQLRACSACKGQWRQRCLSLCAADQQSLSNNMKNYHRGSNEPQAS